MVCTDREGFGWTTNVSDLVTYGLFSTASGGTIHSTGGPVNGPWRQLGQIGIGGDDLKALPNSNLNTGFLGVFVYPRFGESDVTFIFGNANTGVFCFAVQVANTGYIFIRQGNYNGTIVASSAGVVVAPNAHSYIMIGYSISATGFVTVKDTLGNVLVTYSGDTRNGQTNATHITIMDTLNNGQSGYSNYFLFDTTGTVNNTWSSEWIVNTRLPTGNNSVQFTPNGMAANYQNVNQVPPVPLTDYNSSLVANYQDTFTVAALPTYTSLVADVCVKRIAEKVNAGSHTDQSILISGATTQAGVVNNLLTVPFVNVAPGNLGSPGDGYGLDPNTGVAWTVAAANAVKPGYKALS